MFLVRILTLKKQFQQLDQQLERFRKLVGREN